MTKTSDKDEQLELKKRARRRLVGAVVFVSVAAVVLPLVMDEEPPRLAGGIELHIPAQEKGYTPPAVALAVPAQGAAPAGEAVPPVVAEPLAAPTPVAVPAGEQTKSDTEADGKPDAKAGTKPDAKPEANDDAKPLAAPKAPAAAKAGKPAATAGDAVRAQAILDGRAEKATGAKGNGQYIVLIGAFANPGNVQLIQKKLGEMGIRVYTEALDTPQGRKTRVRAGPFASHDAAERAAARMKKIGIGGVVAAKS